MRAGLLQQVDTPKELYENPRNLFVAGFIGSPAMNFMPARLEGGALHLPFGRAELPDELRRRLEAGDGGKAREVIAGVRPEHFEDSQVAGDSQGGLRFRTKVDVLESMGSELYAYFHVEGQTSSQELQELAEDAGMADLPGAEDASQVVARLSPESGAAQGAEAELVLDAEKVLVFDPETGDNLTAR